MPSTPPWALIMLDADLGAAADQLAAGRIARRRQRHDQADTDVLRRSARTTPDDASASAAASRYPCPRMKTPFNSICAATIAAISVPVSPAASESRAGGRARRRPAGPAPAATPACRAAGWCIRARWCRRRDGVASSARPAATASRSTASRSSVRPLRRKVAANDAVARQALDRRVARRADRLEVRRRQVLCRGGEDADLPARQLLDQQQRRGRDRHRRQRLELLLVEREEAAARRQPDRALGRQRLGIRLQRRQHARPVGMRRDRVGRADAAAWCGRSPGSRTTRDCRYRPRSAGTACRASGCRAASCAGSAALQSRS